MSIDICIGPEFKQGTQGELELKICGNPADQAWPYASDPADTNGLRRDPNCGLWAPPAPMILRVKETVANAPARNMAAGETFMTPTWSEAITNPSPDLPMLLDLTFRWTQAMGQEDDSISYMLAGWDKNGVGTVAANSVMSEKPGTQIIGGMIGFPGNYSERMTDLLAPGETATYRLVSGMLQLTGTGLFTSQSAYIDGLGHTVIG